MVAGYARLSRDDDGSRYVSIENQRLIISQYAEEKGMEVGRWYEDDGVSGYVFERPGFMQMMDDLEKGIIDTVIVKDFSRLGRHNAKVLLLLDEFAERGKRLIVVDDQYDTTEPDDDIIGIKTWYNEHYVKEASKKIRRVFRARQEAGTLAVAVPFGYERDKDDRYIIKVAERQADIVRLIFRLYIEGMGYRRLSLYLTEHGYPTPSMVRRQEGLSQGKPPRAAVEKWSDNMVKDILKNDFYIGTFRLHKRERKRIHAPGTRIPPEEQYIFPDHHPPIISKADFRLARELQKKRNREGYHGNHKWEGEKNINPFSSCLFCADCGSRLTPAIRKRKDGSERKYYICSTYNTKGRRYCQKAHLITEEALMKDLILYLAACRDALKDVIDGFSLEEDAGRTTAKQQREEAGARLQEYKEQLKMVFQQKARDLAMNQGRESLILETYGKLQQELMSQIEGQEKQMKALEQAELGEEEVKERLGTAQSVIGHVIQGGVLSRKDIEILVERIEVDGDGMPQINLKYGLSDLTPFSIEGYLNQKENEIICRVLEIVRDEKREFTSAKHIAAELKSKGIQKSNKSVLPYITLLIEEGILEPTGNPKEPYWIVGRLKVEEYIRRLHFAKGESVVCPKWYSNTS